MKKLMILSIAMFTLLLPSEQIIAKSTTLYAPTQENKRNSAIPEELRSKLKELILNSKPLLKQIPEESQIYYLLSNYIQNAEELLDNPIATVEEYETYIDIFEACITYIDQYYNDDILILIEDFPIRYVGDSLTDSMIRDWALVTDPSYNLTYTISPTLGEDYKLEEEGIYSITYTASNGEKKYTQSLPVVVLPVPTEDIIVIHNNTPSYVVGDTLTDEEIGSWASSNDFSYFLSYTISPKLERNGDNRLTDSGLYEITYTAENGEYKFSKKILLRVNTSDSSTSESSGSGTSETSTTTTESSSSGTSETSTTTTESSGSGTSETSTSDTSTSDTSISTTESSDSSSSESAVPQIIVSDKIMYIGDTLTSDDILKWATFKNSDGLAIGFEVIGEPINVYQSTNTLTKSGRYKIKYFVKPNTRDISGKYLAEKTITLTVKPKETSFEPNYSNIDGKTKPIRPKSTRSSLPKTGETSSFTLITIGSLTLLVCGFYIVIVKKKMNRDTRD